MSSEINGGLPAEAPKIDYRLEGENIVREDKDGVQIVAKYERKSKTLRLIREFSGYRRPVIHFLNQNELPHEVVVFDGAEIPKDIAGQKNIPPKPKKNPRLGDKTPALVEWYKKYAPAEYEARYGIKGTAMVKKQRFRFNEMGEKVAENYEEECIIAERKTHLTEKVEGAELNSEEYDWDSDMPKGGE
jgi:hypothetical protein